MKFILRELHYEKYLGARLDDNTTLLLLQYLCDLVTTQEKLRALNEANYWYSIWAVTLNILLFQYFALLRRKCYLHIKPTPIATTAAH